MQPAIEIVNSLVEAGLYATLLEDDVILCNPKTLDEREILREILEASGWKALIGHGRIVLRTPEAEAAEEYNYLVERCRAFRKNYGEKIYQKFLSDIR